MADGGRTERQVARGAAEAQLRRGALECEQRRSAEGSPAAACPVAISDENHSSQVRLSLLQMAISSSKLGKRSIFSHLKESPLAIFEPLRRPPPLAAFGAGRRAVRGAAGRRGGGPVDGRNRGRSQTERNWGTAVSATAWFLRPVPMANLPTQLTVLSEGGSNVKVARQYAMARRRSGSLAPPCG